MPRKHRDLKFEERENLSLELKCCFFYYPWDTSADIRSVENWVELNYVNYLPEDFIDGSFSMKEKARNRCRTDIWKLINLVNDIVKEKENTCAEKIITNIKDLLGEN